MKKEKVILRWLDRNVAALGPNLLLCLSEGEFDAVLQSLNINNSDSWLGEGDGATHVFETNQGVLCIVCIDKDNGYEPIETASILVHEAVHVWQMYREHIGEKEPGLEQEAYGIEKISYELMSEYSRRVH